MSRKSDDEKESDEEEEEDDESKEEKEIKIKGDDIKSQNSEKTEIKEQSKKLIVMLIPKIEKELPLP